MTSAETEGAAPGAADAFHHVINKKFPEIETSRAETDMLLIELWALGFQLAPVAPVARLPGSKWDQD